MEEQKEQHGQLWRCAATMCMTWTKDSSFKTISLVLEDCDEGYNV